MSIPTIPVLRRGVVYRSLDLQDLKQVGDGPAAARLSMANSGLVKRDLLSAKKARDVLRKYSSKELLAICIRAGEHFLHDTLPVGEENLPQSPDDYLKSLAGTSGLPHRLIRMNMNKLHEVFTEMPTIIKGLTRGLNLDVIDKGYGTQAGLPVSYMPTTDALGVVLPSNSPAVNALWMPSIVLKIPVILKPGREEPWTPWRIMQAFVKAGCPREAFSFYPTSHDGGGAIIRRAGRVMMFGDDATVAQYAHDERVEVHGSGHSKILIGEDVIERWPEFLDVLVESVSANSGRSCINTSTIVAPRYADEIAEAVGKRLQRVQPLPADDENAVLSGFANPAFADYIDGAIESGLETPGARDVMAEERGSDRHIVYDNMHYLKPTIVRCDVDHPLADREFLFPYASVVEVPQAEMLDQIGSTLVATAITEDAGWVNELLECPKIDRLNVGPWPTNRVKWDQPHEGNLFEFLYKRRSILMTPVHVG
ncbi:MAG: aldehyde dehydrogenase family protein [Verrucomicrobiota bacterium]